MANFTARATRILTSLKRAGGGGLAAPFLEPVDPVAMQLPTYTTVCPQPMDLGTAGEKLARGSYGRLEEFANDIRLVWVRRRPGLGPCVPSI